MAVAVRPRTSSGCSTTSTRPSASRRCALVREGRLYDLGRVLDENVPVFPGRYFRQTLVTTAHHAQRRRRSGTNRVNWITEQVTGTQQLGTHLDALSHLQIGDRGYNGWSVAELAGTAGVRAARRRDRAADRDARLARRRRPARARAT